MVERPPISARAEMQFFVGNIFLTRSKPVSPGAIRIILRDHGGSTAAGSVIDPPAIGQPALLSRAYRLRDYVRHLAMALKLSGHWEFEAAAMLSHIGFLDLPRDIILNLCAGGPLSGVERKTLAARAAAGAALLWTLPELRVVADIVGYQFKPYRDIKGELEFRQPVIAFGSQMLHAAGGFDRLLSDGFSQSDALEQMFEQTLEYNPELLSLLRTFDVTMCAAREPLPMRLPEQ